MSLCVRYILCHVLIYDHALSSGAQEQRNLLARTF